jgi:hypothetical protein
LVFLWIGDRGFGLVGISFCHGLEDFGGKGGSIWGCGKGYYTRLARYLPDPVNRISTGKTGKILILIITAGALAT